MPPDNSCLVHFTGEVNSFELEADGVNALLGRCEVDLTQAVVEIADLARVNLSARRRQRRLHIQRVRACSTI